jgi:hypothetical protein
LDCLESEQEAIVCAVLGHWLFGFIHPYMDGNDGVVDLLDELVHDFWTQNCRYNCESLLRRRSVRAALPWRRASSSETECIAGDIAVNLPDVLRWAPSLPIWDRIGRGSSQGPFARP